MNNQAKTNEPHEDQSSGPQNNRTSMNPFINDSKSGKQDFQIDIKMAQRFLTLLAEDTEMGFSFQIFSDKKNKKPCPKILHGSLEAHQDELIQLNRAGAGVFVTINETDGKGRSKDNIIRVRAVFVDLDGSPLQPILDGPLSPHIVIESSPGRYHAYWIVEGIDLAHFTLIQEKLSKNFNGDPKICDLSRVMRLPGFYHQKDTPFLTKIIRESGAQPFSLKLFLDSFGIDLSPPKTAKMQSNPVLEALTQHQMIISQQSHPMGCWTIRCPWGHLHSTQDLGTKYYEPNTNGYANHGFQCFHSHCKTKTSQDLLAFLGIGTSQKTEPLPLYRPLETAQPYPFDTLGDVLGSAAKALQKVIKAPDAICAQSVLAAASLAVQAHANVIMTGREIPLSVFFITVAESGDRKSATDKVALKSISDWQKMLANCYRAEFQKFQLLQESWETLKKEWLKTNEDAQAIFPTPAPTAPTRPLLLVEEPTYEGIVKYFAADGQPSIGLFSDEGGRFFGGHAMNEENQLKTISGLSSIWDGHPISRMRSVDGDMLIYNRRLSVHLMIQEIILKQLMSNRAFDEQGFLPRCLIAFPNSTAGKRPYVEQDLNSDPAIQRYWKTLNHIYDRPFPLEAPPAPQNQLKPRPLGLNQEATQRWIEFHNAIDLELAAGKRFHVIRRFANKAAEHVLRLSGVLTLIEDFEAKEINLEHIERAIQLVNYYLNERMRIQGFISINENLIRAASLLNWLWEQGRMQIGLCIIYQFGPSSLGIRNAEMARKTMMVLQEHGWATPLTNACIEGKHLKEAWSITPPPPDMGIK